MLLSVEPTVVREAAEAAAAIAAPSRRRTPRPPAGDWLGLAAPRAESQLRLAGAITARLLSALR